MEVLRGLMCRTVTITDAGGEEVPWSPIPAAILPANGDEFFTQWPEATHSLWAHDADLITTDHVLAWLDPVGGAGPRGREVRACVLGPAQSWDGQDPKRRVPIRVEEGS